MVAAIGAVVAIWSMGGPLVAAAQAPLDGEQLAAQGIRIIEGKHLTLYTDLPPDEEIDILPQVFDLAVPQWCAYFGIDPVEVADWHMRGSLMKDKESRALFVRTGLLRADVPDFGNGYSTGRSLWLYEQPTGYYRRHLLLHEGTHGFMNTLLRGAGPPWYTEGIAELLATHAYDDGRLQMNYFPASREEVPMLGRIKMIETARAERRMMPLEAVLNYDNRAHRENEAYAWCWALAKFLDTHARYQARFRSLVAHVRDPDFATRFAELFADDWPNLAEEWQHFAATLTHGHDIERTAIDWKPGAPLASRDAQVTVLAERGWQSSGLRLVAGVNYRITAEGRFQVADQPKIWWSEPGGVTIRYHAGRPLGMLLGVVRPDRQRAAEIPVGEQASETPFLSPFEIGTDTTVAPAASGTLYLRINDSPGELNDNAGSLDVRVSAS